MRCRATRLLPATTRPFHWREAECSVHVACHIVTFCTQHLLQPRHSPTPYDLLFQSSHCGSSHRGGIQQVSGCTLILSCAAMTAHGPSSAATELSNAAKPGRGLCRLITVLTRTLVFSALLDSILLSKPANIMNRCSRKKTASAAAHVAIEASMSWRYRQMNYSPGAIPTLSKCAIPVETSCLALTVAALHLSARDFRTPPSCVAITTTDHVPAGTLNWVGMPAFLHASALSGENFPSRGPLFRSRILAQGHLNPRLSCQNRFAICRTDLFYFG